MWRALGHPPGKGVAVLSCWEYGVKAGPAQGPAGLMILSQPMTVGPWTPPFPGSHSYLDRPTQELHGWGACSGTVVEILGVAGRDQLTGVPGQGLGRGVGGFELQVTQSGSEQRPQDAPVARHGRLQSGPVRMASVPRPRVTQPTAGTFWSHCSYPADTGLSARAGEWRQLGEVVGCDPFAVGCLSSGFWR